MFLRFLQIGVGLLSATIAIHSQVVPASRMIDWSHVGIPGGIPHRTTIFTNFSAGASVSAVQAAIDQCPFGQVIFLGPGTYTWSVPLNLSRNGVTVRGAGPDKTIISHSVSGYNGGITIQSGVISGNGRIIPLASGYTKGSTNLTLAASDASLKVGYHVTIDQENDGTLVNNNGVGGFRKDTTPEGDGLRSLAQMVEIRAISGLNVQIWPPLYWTYSASLKPQFYYRPGAATNNQVLWSGVEDLCLSNRNPDGFACLMMSRASYCWARNLKTENPSVNHVQFWRSYRCEIRHSECNGSMDTTSGNGYGIELDYQSCANLIEDNIIANNRDFIKVNSGSSGNVIAYNYHTNCVPNTDVPAFSPHGGGHHSAHPLMNLWEGNIGFKWVSDFYWGSVSHSTLLRNWFRGSAATPYAKQSGAGLIIDEHNMYFNIIGNILGDPALDTNQNWTQKFSTRISPETHAYERSYATFRIGYYSDGDSGGGRSGADEWASHIVAGNYDYVSKRQDWYNPSSPQPIPASYAYSSKPAFFGSLQWPPFDAANPGTAQETSIPAGYRHRFGVDPSGQIGQNQAPIAMADGSPKSGIAPLAVVFSSSGSSDPEGATLTFNWTFGDGTTSTQQHPSHTYSAPGTYAARLTVSDGTNSASSANIPISVFVEGAGLIASYSFDEGSGSSVSDRSGNNNTGTISGATWTAGKSGQALSFDGSSVVTIPDSASLRAANGLTIAAWVYPTSPATDWSPIVFKPLSSTQISFVLQGASPPSGAPSFHVFPSTINVYGTSAIPLNAWSHLAATYDGATMRLYLNGTEVGNKVQTGALNYSMEALTIGGNPLYQAFWRGAIDEVRIYNRALAASEIQVDIDQAAKPSPPQNLRIVNP